MYCFQFFVHDSTDESIVIFGLIIVEFQGVNLRNCLFSVFQSCRGVPTIILTFLNT